MPRPKKLSFSPLHPFSIFTFTMKNNPEKKKGELMMLCGALHDIAEMSREENIVRHVKKVQEKLEQIINGK